MPCLRSRSLEKMVSWDRTPLGLETAAPCQSRAALAAEGSERRGDLLNLKIPALHREAERDTTGNLAVSLLVHTWIGTCVQEKRHCTAMPCLRL